MIWKSCADLPNASSNGRAMAIGGYVYFASTFSVDLYLVHCYDTSQDIWTTLPPPPVRHFGIGQIDGKLVTVGGLSRNNKTTNQLYTYDKISHKWEQTFPPMPTARYSLDVLSLQSALVAVGGIKQFNLFTNAVEILKLDVMQWCKAAKIPVACTNIPLVAIGSTCYAIGGCHGFHKDTTYLNQALYASVDNLLCSAVATNETISSNAK